MDTATRNEAKLHCRDVLRLGATISRAKYEGNSGTDGEGLEAYLDAATVKENIARRCFDESKATFGVDGPNDSLAPCATGALRTRAAWTILGP